MRVKVGLAPISTGPTIHSPTVLLYVPWLGVSVRKETPGGSASCTVTAVAVSGLVLNFVTT